MTTHFSKRSIIIATLALLVAARPNRAHKSVVHAGSAAASSPASLAISRQRRTARCVRLLEVIFRIPRPPVRRRERPSCTIYRGFVIRRQYESPALQRYRYAEGVVAQHATDILASCATGSVTSGITSKIPGAGSLPSCPPCLDLTGDALAGRRCLRAEYLSMAVSLKLNLCRRAAARDVQSCVGVVATILSAIWTMNLRDRAALSAL